MLLAVSCRNNGAAPERRWIVGIFAFKERHQAKGKHWPTLRVAPCRKKSGPRLEGIKCDRKMSRRSWILITFSGPAEPRQIHATTQAHGIKHPLVLSREDTRSATPLL